MLRRLDLRSWMIVPLVAHDRVLGAVSFAITESARRYTPVDLALAETVGHRAASAIENARLYKEAQAARAEAETANRLKDEFLAMLGHELRNPLGAISNAVHILDRVEDARGQSATHAREIITRQVQHLGGLIDDLLDVGRVVTGKIRLDRGPLDLFQAVERALHTLGAVGKTSDHSIRVQGESVWIDGDVTRIEQIVLNLVENALRYTPAGGSIHLDTHRAGGRAILRVQDSGMGIQRDLLPRIFDLFVQGDRGADRAHGGLGIGLTLVKRLVELHDGTAEAASAGPGAGSVFTISFPALSLPSLPVATNPAGGPRAHTADRHHRGQCRFTRDTARALSDLRSRGTRGRGWAERRRPRAPAASRRRVRGRGTPRLRWLRSRAAHPGRRGQREALPHRGDWLWSTRGSGTGTSGGIQLSSRQAGSSKPDQYPAAKPRHGVAGSHRGRGVSSPGRDANTKLLRP
jgi:Osmosensitive K+ channel histidine kinase